VPGPKPVRDPSEGLLRRARLRLAGVTLLLVATLVIAIGITSALVSVELMRQTVDRALDAAAADPMTLQALLEGDDSSEVQGRLAQADTFVLLVDADGRVYGNTSGVHLDGLPDMSAVAAAANGSDRRSGHYGDLDLRLLTASLGRRVSEREGGESGSDENEGGGSGIPLYVQAGHDLSLQREMERQLMLALVLIGLLGLAGAALVTTFVTRRALGPIREAFATERRFVASASHELRTPVAIMRASAEILDREGHVAEPGRPLLHDIIGESDRLARLVGDLLALASVEAGALHLDRRPVDVQAWFEAISRRCHSLADDRGLRLESSIAGAESGPRTRVSADTDRLDQVLLVLVDNALDHSPAGGTVRLALTIDRRDAVAIIEVTDEGPGIDPAELDTIFEPFVRSATPARANRAGRGAGLGLAIARQLAGQHGAQLEVTSEPGHGATFRLQLPLLRGSDATG
jgi:signal transduction histidine kinase